MSLERYAETFSPREEIGSLYLTLRCASKLHQEGIKSIYKPDSLSRLKGYFYVFRSQLLTGYAMDQVAAVVAYGRDAWVVAEPERVGGYARSPGIFGWSRVEATQGLDNVAKLYDEFDKRDSWRYFGLKGLWKNIWSSHDDRVWRKMDDLKYQTLESIEKYANPDIRYRNFVADLVSRQCLPFENGLAKNIYSLIDGASRITFVSRPAQADFLYPEGMFFNPKDLYEQWSQVSRRGFWGGCKGKIELYYGQGNEQTVIQESPDNWRYTMEEAFSLPGYLNLITEEYL